MKNRIRPYLSKLPLPIQAAVVRRCAALSAAGMHILRTESDPDIWTETYRFGCPNGCCVFEATGMFILNPEIGPLEVVRLHTERVEGGNHSSVDG